MHIINEKFCGIILIIKMISVIIPIYNVEQYLDTCIQSILQQSYKDLEIILVDDGSTDRCPLICDEYAKKDDRIKVIHKENAGQGMARNDALDIAIGEYVIFVDSDDFLAENAIELLSRASENGKYDIVYAAMYNGWTPKSGGTVLYSFDEVKCGEKEITEALADLTASPWNSSLPAIRFMGACGYLIKRNIIIDNCLRFHSVQEVGSEDLVFLYDLYQYINSIRYIPEPLYYYRLNINSTSHVFRGETHIACIDVAFKYLQRSSIARNKEIRIRIYKHIIRDTGITYEKILSSSLSLIEKRRLCHLIYIKSIWKQIIEECQVKALPHSYRYYLDVFLHKRFYMSLLRHKLYKLRKTIKCRIKKNYV